MSSIVNSVTIAAGAATPNVLAGSAFEFLPGPAKLDIAVVGDAGSKARATIQAGSDILLEESQISAKAAIPIWPDDYIVHDVAPAGARLKIGIRNTDGVNPITVFYAVKLTPLM